LKRTVLITGGAGFIGSNFTNFWHSNYPEDRIIVLDKLTYAGDLDSIHRALQSPNVEFLHGDVVDAAVVEHCVSQANLVFHFAAETHVTRSLFDCRDFVLTDVLGTQNLLAAVVRNRSRIQKFVHISSSEVYGTAEEPLMDENHPLNPLSPYAAAKCGADRLVYSFIESYNIPAIIVRPFNNFGPQQHLEKLIPRFITGALTGEQLTIHGDGSSSRDFIFVEDTCRIIRTIVEENVNLASTGHVINLGTGSSISVDEIATKVLAKLPGATSSVRNIEDRPAQVLRHTASQQRLGEIYDLKLLTDFSHGLDLTIEWYKNNERWWRKRWDSREIEITIQDGKKVLH
jgi:dTDP-glucose 4,6-dehydratase